MNMKTGWKFLDWNNGKIVSRHDCSPWTIGKWREVPKPTQTCVGLNCSRTPDDAHNYVSGNVVAIVEYKGSVIDTGDKLTCQYMRIKKAWHFPASAEKAYQEATAPAWKAYQEAANAAWKAYQEAATAAWKAYREAATAALKAYQEAMTTALEKILRTCERVR